MELLTVNEKVQIECIYNIVKSLKEEKEIANIKRLN